MRGGAISIEQPAQLFVQVFPTEKAIDDAVEETLEWENKGGHVVHWNVIPHFVVFAGLLDDAPKSIDCCWDLLN